METLKFLLFLIFLFFLSCDKSKEEYKSPCETDNPLEDILWLKEKKDLFDKSSYQTTITQYKHNGDYIFFIDFCVQCSDSPTTIYNCQGELLCMSGGIIGNICPEYDFGLSEGVIIYRNY